MGYIGWQDKDPQNHTTKATSSYEIAFVVYIYIFFFSMNLKLGSYEVSSRIDSEEDKEKDGKAPER